MPPPPFGRRVSWYGGKRDSEEKCLLKMVASGGVCHPSVLGEEALLTNLKSREERHITGQAREALREPWHSDV